MLESKTDQGGDDQLTTDYEYDAVGNLRSVALPDGDLVEYVVDGVNRRVGKKLNGELVYRLVYHDQLNPVARLDPAGNIDTLFVYATASHVPDYMVLAGRTYRPMTNHLGSVRLVVDTETGAVAQHLDYDEFGRVVLDSNPGFQPFGFAGGLYDHETGLVRFGARDYDPVVGRWTATDPILFGGGQSNLYVYASNNPLNWIDPEGLEIRVYSSDAFGVSGANHAFVWATEAQRGRGTNGSSGAYLGGWSG